MSEAVYDTNWKNVQLPQPRARCPSGRWRSSCTSPACGYRSRARRRKPSRTTTSSAGDEARAAGVRSEAGAGLRAPRWCRKRSETKEPVRALIPGSGGGQDYGQERTAMWEPGEALPAFVDVRGARAARRRRTNGAPPAVAAGETAAEPVGRRSSQNEKKQKPARPPAKSRRPRRPRRASSYGCSIDASPWQPANTSKGGRRQAKKPSAVAGKMKTIKQVKKAKILPVQCQSHFQPLAEAPPHQLGDKVSLSPSFNV